VTDATRADRVALERAAALGWVAPEQRWLGDWLLRAAGGFTGRANSALVLGDPGCPLVEAVARVQRFYRERDLAATIAVPFELDGPGAGGVDALLAAQGWQLREDPAVVMTAPAAPFAVGSRCGLAADGPPPVRLDDRPDEAWLRLYHYRGQPLPPMARRLLTSAPAQLFASVREGGQVLAIGRLAFSGAAGGDWAGLTAIEVAPGQRRRGLGTAVTAALCSAAAGRGARALYLQVAEGNTPARELYRRLGFTDHHRYHYRLAPGR
jgi:ribosomal protein S18 acetylase RimI-like enzyme